MAKEKSFEESIISLEKIVETLENDDISLEESIKKYKEGIGLVNICNEAIDRIEKELEIITEEKA